MTYRLIQSFAEAQRWRGEPYQLWLEDSFISGLSKVAVGRLERHANSLGGQNGWVDNEDTDVRQMIAEIGAPAVIVLSGAVRIFQTRRDGSAMLIDVAGGGDLLNPEQFSGTTTKPMSMSFAGPTILIAIARREFRSLMTTNREILESVLFSTGKRVETLSRRLEHFNRVVEHRLWAYLVELGRRHGFPARNRYTAIKEGRCVNLGENSIILDIGLTQLDLAAALGTTKTSIENAARSLAQKRKITVGYAWVCIHELPPAEELDQSFLASRVDGRNELEQ